MKRRFRMFTSQLEAIRKNHNEEVLFADNSSRHAKRSERYRSV